MAEKPTYEKLERRVQELEKKLHEARSLSEEVMTYMSEGFVLTDTSASIIFMNKSLSEMLGYKPEEIIGKVWLDLVPPEQQTIAKEAESKRSQGYTDRYEILLHRKNGEKFPVLIGAGPRFDKQDGQYIGSMGVVTDITERKRMEDALRESEEKYRILFEHTGEALFVAQDGKIVFQNPRSIELSGYSVEEFQSKPFLDFIHEDDREMVMDRHIRRLRGEKLPEHYAFRIIHKKGSILWAELNAVLIQWNGYPAVLCFMADVTKRKQAEEALRESNKTAHQFFSESSAGAFFMMLDEPVEWNDSVNKEKILDYVFDHQHITKINRAMLDQYLASDKDFLYMTPKQLFAHDLEHGRLLWRKMFDQGFLDIESDERRFDGSQMWIIGSYRCMFDEKGRIIGHFGTQFDITERKRAEAQLRLQSLVLDQIEDRVTVTDLNGVITYVNEAEVRAFGYSRNELIGVTTDKYGEDPDRGATQRQIVAETLEKGAWRGQVVNQTLAGEDVILDCRTRVVLDEQGNKIALAGISTDITDLKKMEAQLNQAQKMESVGRLAGGVAHDFNNMLGVILGHTELALLKTDEDNDLVSDLNEIQKAANRSADITKQLLAFARKQTISPKQIDLNDTVESMLNMLHRLIGEDIDLVWQPGAYLWPVKMDPAQLDQILANLCVNARDAISGAGKLTVETGRKTFDEEYCNEHAGFIPGHFVLLAVSDNGCGMDKETLRNLFEPFFSTKEMGKGTGLGLATVYGIVKQNNGFINVYSELGQGSTFKIYLPRLVAEEDGNTAVSEKITAAGGTETILLVEDEPTILRMTRMMLEKKGYGVLSAATPAEAIDLAKTHADKIHLLMTDVVMPEMNGRELAEKITNFYPDIGLLFMSGYTSNVIAHHGVLDDGVAFIQKPFSMADMTEKVRAVLDTVSNEDHL